MNIVFSRPIVSETKPKNGRPNPSKIRSSEMAKVSAAICRPNRLTGTSATRKSWAMGAICAAAIRPPEATITKIAYMTQKTGVRTTSRGVRSTLVWGRRRLLRWIGTATDGLRNRNDSRTTMAPWPRPKYRKASW